MDLEIYQEKNARPDIQDVIIKMKNYQKSIDRNQTINKLLLEDEDT